MSSNYSRSDILQKLSNTLHNMLEHAHNDDWEEVARCNTLRFNLSSQLESSQGSQDSDEKQLIDMLCKIDLEILELAKSARNAVAGDMKNLNGRKSNVNQYLRNQHI